MFQSCWDGATAAWVLPVLLGSKCALLKDTTRVENLKDRFSLHATHMKQGFQRGITPATDITWIDNDEKKETNLNSKDLV